MLEQRRDPDLGGGDLARGQQRRQLGLQAAVVELGVQPAQRLQRAPRQRLAPPLPQDGAQLVVLGEAHSVVTAVQMPVGDRQQVTDLPVGVVHHRVEHGHVAQARVVGAAGQRDQVHVGVVVNPQLAHAGAERPVPHDRRRDHVPAGRTRHHVGRDLPAGERAHREVPQRALPRDRLVDAVLPWGDGVIRGTIPPRPPRLLPGGTHPPGPPLGGAPSPQTPLAPLGGGPAAPPYPAGGRIVQYRVALEASTSRPSISSSPLASRSRVRLLAVVILRRGSLRLKHGWRDHRSAAGRRARRCPAAGRTAGTAAGPPTRSWPRAARRRGQRPA